MSPSQLSVVVLCCVVCVGSSVCVCVFVCVYVPLVAARGVARLGPVSPPPPPHPTNLATRLVAAYSSGAGQVLPDWARFFPRSGPIWQQRRAAGTLSSLVSSQVLPDWFLFFRAPQQIGGISPPRPNLAADWGQGKSGPIWQRLAATQRAAASVARLGRGGNRAQSGNALVAA